MSKPLSISLITIALLLIIVGLFGDTAILVVGISLVTVWIAVRAAEKE